MKLKKNTVIITSGNPGNNKFIESYLSLLSSIFTGSIYLITTGEHLNNYGKYENLIVLHIPLKPAKNPISQVKNYMKSQFLIAKIMPKNEHIYLFFLGQTLIIPILVLKLFQKKVVLVIGSSEAQVSKLKGKINYMLILFEKISFKLSNHIILYSNNLIKDWDLVQYQNKIKIAHRHFLKFDRFRLLEEYEKREKIVGFIGRFSAEKAIINLIKSIPLILKNDPEIKFLIIGDGFLLNQTLNLISELKIEKKVKIISKVEFNQIPLYLNQMKLLVLPSYTEGLPNVVIESMACGTPVLANSVGSVPDMILNQETGFILKNNSPECIAEGVINSLNHEKISKISENAKNYVNENFDFKIVSQTYKETLKQIINEK